MTINLETPKRFHSMVSQARSMASEVFRPISRKYDREEHAYPRELDLVGAVVDAMDDSETTSGGGASASAGAPTSSKKRDKNKVRNGANMGTVLGIMQTCWGDVGLTLSMPRQGLGNAAIAAVATDEQKARYGDQWAAMAITEPESGSDAASIKTTAVKDGDDYVLNGEKIYVTSGERASLVVVWATLDPSMGKAAIKSFVVSRDNPGLKLDRLEHKLGIRASDTAAFVLTDCRVPAKDLLGSPEIEKGKSFAGAMQTFDNTRPMVAAMAVGLARACLDLTTSLLAEAGIEADPDALPSTQVHAATKLLELEADYESAYLLTMRAAWMADNGQPNSLQASMAKAKAGRSCVEIAHTCVKLVGSSGYSENELLEKWSRDAKILDIFEGTQQIQQLIIARRLLELSSSKLK